MPSNNMRNAYQLQIFEDFYTTFCVDDAKKCKKEQRKRKCQKYDGYYDCRRCCLCLANCLNSCIRLKRCASNDYNNFLFIHLQVYNNQDKRQTNTANKRTNNRTKQ